jgi:hypothetical protein
VQSSIDFFIYGDGQFLLHKRPLIRARHM